MAVTLANATLIDGTGGPASRRAWVRIEGETIAAVGDGAPPSGSPNVRDLSGHTLVPGLADMHVHLEAPGRAQWMLPLFLAHGVTRLKEAGNRLGSIAAIKRWSAAHPSPYVATSGVTLNGSEAEKRFLLPGKLLQRAIDDNLAFGVEFLKIHNWVSSGALRQIVSAGRAADVPVTGHVPLGMTSVGALDAGMSVLEHVRVHAAEAHADPEIVASSPLDLVVMKRTAHWARFDPANPTIARTLDAWEERRDSFFLDPTLVVQEVVSGMSEGAPAHQLERFPADLRERWRTVKGDAEFLEELTPEEDQAARASVFGMCEFTRLAHARGIRLLTGSDTGGGWAVPGASLIRELELLVSSGLSPVQAIHASTGAASAAFRQTDRGTIRPGQRADLLIVAGDVAADITAARNTRAVYLGGTELDIDALIREAQAVARDDPLNE